jgi:phosphoribosylanthranilate isomerase
VDVSSGVEDVPGVKDPDKIYEFVRAARAAALRMETEQ